MSGRELEGLTRDMREMMLTLSWPRPLVTPPLKVGDEIRCMCEHFHPIALFDSAGTPVLSCPDVLRGHAGLFPAEFHTGEIIEFLRVPD